MGQGELMSSGSNWIPGIRKTRAWKKRAKRMMTELNLFKEFVICSIDELRDEKKSEWQRPFWKKASSLDFSVSERSPAIVGSAYTTLDKTKARKIISSIRVYSFSSTSGRKFKFPVLVFQINEQLLELFIVKTWLLHLQVVSCDLRVLRLNSLKIALQPIPREGRGREGKGREREREGRTIPALFFLHFEPWSVVYTL